MHQAIPYRSWRDLHTHTAPLAATPLSSLTTSNSTIINAHTASSNIVSPKCEAATPTDHQGGITVSRMALENAVTVFARRGCCLSHVAKRLLLGLGVNPAVHEVEEEDEGGVVRELEAVVAGANHDGEGVVGKVQFPAVFIGGKLFGGLDRLMATHISGELVPILKQAGALWL